MPSIPTWYRAPMIGIHSTLSSNCSPSRWRSKPSAIATASTSAAPVMRIPRRRIVRSFSFGITAITNAPTMGNKVVIVIAEFSHVIWLSRSLSHDPDEDDGQGEHAHEQSDRVPLHVAGLQGFQCVAGPARRAAGAVDDAVDHVPVEPHHGGGQALGEARRARYHRIEH